MWKVLFRHYRTWMLCLLGAAVLSSLSLLRLAHTQTGPVELIERRTLQSKTFRNPNGTLTLKAYGGPVHYPDAAGRLQDMNPNLRSQSIGEYSHIVDGLPYAVRAGPNAASPLQLTKGSDYVIYRLLGASVLATAAVSGNQVQYPNAFTQTDVRYSIGPRGLKESLVLRSALAPTAFAYTVETNLQVAQQPNGLVFTKPRGELVFFVANPFAVDARGRRVENMRYTVSTVSGRTQLAVTLPSVAGLTYPITIDPATSLTPWQGDGSVRKTGADWPSVITASSGTLAVSTGWTADLGSYYDGTNYNNGRVFLTAVAKSVFPSEP